MGHFVEWNAEFPSNIACAILCVKCDKAVHRTATAHCNRPSVGFIIAYQTGLKPFGLKAIVIAGVSRHFKFKTASLTVAINRCAIEIANEAFLVTPSVNQHSQMVFIVNFTIEANNACPASTLRNNKAWGFVVRYLLRQIEVKWNAFKKLIVHIFYLFVVNEILNIAIYVYFDIQLCLAKA